MEGIMSFSAPKVAPANSPSPRGLAHSCSDCRVPDLAGETSIFHCPLPSIVSITRCSSWLLAALLVTAVLFTVAEAEILIEPRVGFRGVFQLGRPFPLEVELSNSGRPAEGVLQVQVWKGGAAKGGTPFAVNYRREVFLPARARKTIQLTVDPDFIS